MYIIKHARIDGIWGWKNIETDFHEDVSIFIGANGSGKTTFINILVAILRVDVNALEELWFDSATLIFEDNTKKKKSQRTMTVTRIHDSIGDEALHFKISRQTFILPYLSGRHMRTVYAQRRIIPVMESIREQIQKIISFSSLSVSRAGISDIDEFNRNEDVKESSRANSIDATLKELMSRLKVYQLKKAEALKEIAREFQEEVFISVLYNPEIDSSEGLRELSNLDLKKEKEDFLATYYQLGIQNLLRRGKAKDLIQRHFNAIQESIDYLSETISENKGVFDVDKIFAFPLMKRTRHILQAGKLAENKRKELFLPIDNYMMELKGYFRDKSLRLSSDGTLNFKDNKRNGQEYDCLKLSSGEKQVLILLTESLLQGGESKLFIADEPELSLHIGWQSKILPSIKKLNSLAQIIVATHSPEVAGEYPENIFDMEDICSE
ncbi:AAA family ATPase [Enterobacter cloacae]|nr:AAA family ATPase [Enterobacter cloacae]